LGIILEDKLNDAKGYIFAALSGIFLYSSLSALFPVLKKDMSDLYDSRRRRLFRLILALGGFLLAMVIIIPLVYFKNDMKHQFKAKATTTAEGHKAEGHKSTGFPILLGEYISPIPRLNREFVKFSKIFFEVVVLLSWSFYTQSTELQGVM